MPVSKRWINFNEENMKQLPNTYGVYQLADNNKEVIYIGKGKLDHNILKHFLDESELKKDTVYFRYRESDSIRSSKLRRNILLKEYKEKHEELPKFN